MMKLRGGQDAQTVLGYIQLSQAVAGYAFTKESIEMYEFKTALETPTLAFAKFNYALQIAHAINLLMPEYGLTAIALAIFASSGEFSDKLNFPRMPSLAWAAAILALQHFKDTVPDWIVPALFLASGIHGVFFTDQALAMYGVKVPLSKQSMTMAKFVNAGFVAIGAFLLAPTLGLSASQAFAAYAATYVAFILKMVTLDGGAELFNAAGAYVWAAIFGGAGVAALMM